MAIRNIVKFGDEVLNKKCRPVERFDEKLWLLLDDMKETLEDAQGAGLAAPQVGMLRQVCVVDVGEGPHRAGEPGDHRHGRGADRSGGVSLRPGGMGRGHPAQEGHRPGPGQKRRLVREDGGGPVRQGLLPRDRPPERRAVHLPRSRILSQDELDALLEQEEQDSEKGE